MELFINPVSENIEIFLLDGTEIVTQLSLPRWDDFRSFPETIISLIDTYPIWEIWCVVWPGAFTRMRIVTLTLSSLRLSRGITLKSCHFFDTIERWTRVLKANDREYIIQTPWSSPQMVDMSDMSKLAKWDMIGYGEKNDFTEGQNFIEYSYDIPFLISLFEGKETEEKLIPIYLKDPHITWSKKNTSRS